MAADNVTILKTDPGSYSALAARSMRDSGLLSLAAFGLNVGQFATASNSPEFGFSTMTVPAFACVS